MTCILNIVLFKVVSLLNQLYSENQFNEITLYSRTSQKTDI